MTAGLEASFWADGDEGLRVKARILKMLLGRARRAEMAAPPWLPVAPVMRSVLVAIMRLCDVV